MTVTAYSANATNAAQQERPAHVKEVELCSDKCHPGHSCTNVRTKVGSCIDLEKLPDKSSLNKKCASPPPWCEIVGITLNLSHKKVLEGSGWLDDDIIAASQYLLKKQHPAIGSLQPPALATKLAMEPQAKELVQVLNLRGESLDCGIYHWM